MFRYKEIVYVVIIFLGHLSQAMSLNDYKINLNNKDIIFLKTRTMVLANKAITVVYIQQSQSAEERRFGLNLMISMLNQNKNSAGETLLPDSAIKLAEFLIGTGTTRFLTVEQLLKLQCWLRIRRTIFLPSI